MTNFALTEMHIVAAQAPAASEEKRTITGLVLPYNRPGYTSAGAVTVPAGAVKLPDDISRIKLLRNHSTDEGFTPVGYATAVDDTPDGLRMSFKIAATADGDVALADVNEKVRDALSVELINTYVDEDHNLQSGELTAVALVPIPAFADARIDLITAALQAPDEEEDDETEGEDEAAEKTDDEPSDDDNENVHPTPDTEDDPAPTEKETDMPSAQAPAGVHAASKAKPITFAQAITAYGDIATGRADSPNVTAALADITYSSQPNTRAPQWLGELWDGADYTREIVPTMTPKPLTSLEVRGWRWKVRPEVDDWVGDKKAIPTNKAETEAVTSKAKRLAAGWDFDRAYWDFNDTEFIRSFFEAAREDYAIKSDERAAQAIVGWATDDSVLTPTAQPDLLHAAAHARQLIKKATHVEPTAFLVHPDDMFGLFDITMLDIPQFLQLLGVDPSKFISTDLVPAGSVVAYAKPAVKWYELAGSPLRVSAQHIAHGGIDEAIFGYWDAMLTDPRGIVTVPIAAPAAAAA